MFHINTTHATGRKLIIEFSASPLYVYNEPTGFYEYLRREYVFNIRRGFRVYETAAGRNPETDHAMRLLAFAFLFKLRQILCNISMYALEYKEVLNFPSISSLLRAHVTALQFVFS